MATLRETQAALQEKLEELREKDHIIEMTEYEVSVKEHSLERLKEQLSESRALVKNLLDVNCQQKELISKLASHLQKCRHLQPGSSSLDDERARTVVLRRSSRSCDIDHGPVCSVEDSDEFATVRARINKFNGI